jgi:hypothetical protein
VTAKSKSEVGSQNRKYRALFANTFKKYRQYQSVRKNFVVQKATLAYTTNGRKYAVEDQDVDEADPQNLA